MERRWSAKTAMMALLTADGEEEEVGGGCGSRVVSLA
jgi:hypothetical protein